MSKLYKFILLALMLISSVAFAQTYKVSGEVTSSQTGEKLIGANVYVKGLAVGAATDADGKYEFNIPSGSYTIICSYIGFEAGQLLNVDVTNNMELDFQLKDYEFSLSVTVLADRAKERETPVAFANIDKKDVEFKLGSQDVPMILNTTPSVYATMGGGGAGDARINIRGFDQRNVAIMINGVPINDMENGWVYWSNWDGVGDATSSIQIQRGLSAINLAAPSVGGTMNVITDPTAASFGGKFKQEFGNDAFLKSTLVANSGLIDDTWAVSAVIVKKTGDGLIDKTWTDAWAYYLGASYNLNNSNRIELYALGAPQRHGQNLYRQNAAAYDHDYARDELGFSQAALDAYPEASAGRNYNENWGPVSSSYKGKQWTSPLFGFTASGGEEDRYDPGFINERENFFHKPIVNLNWYSQLSNKLSLYSTLYYSGGHGGGTGTFGSIRWNYHVGIESPSRFAAWDATVERNRDNGDGGSLGILRNSRNDQWTVGLISKAYYKISDNFKTSFGIDWRTADIDHYREVRDLLGGSHFVDDSDEFSGERNLTLGDKFDYFNTNTVDWIGGFVQGEYSENQWTVFGMAGYSTIKYSFVDHFNSTTDDASGQKVTTDSDNIGGYQVKGGASFRLSPQFTLYSNLGYVSKVPIFDAVINDFDGDLIWDDKNEIFISGEAGLNYRSPDGKVALDANVYVTQWDNRIVTVNDFDQISGDDGLIIISELDALHYGLEFTVALRPINMVLLDAVLSLGNWKNTDDATANFKDYTARTSSELEIYTKDLKTGDQPQTSLILSGTLFPVDGLAISGIVKHYREHYAQWQAQSRISATDRGQSWKAPDYTVVDLHANYNLPLNLKGVNFQVFAHVFNLLDEIYIQDATDNSQFNAYTGNGKAHAADDAEVYFGLPRSFNLGISVLF